MDSQNLRVVRVTAATLWKEPSCGRKIDEPSMTFPVDLAKWTGQMSVPDKLWLVGKLETQALFGQTVQVLEKRGHWVKVAVQEQSTPLHPAGYPGWLPEIQLTRHSALSAYEHCPLMVVTSGKTWLYEDRSRFRPVVEISFNTRLPVLSADPDWIEVAAPEGGSLWIPSQDAAVYESARAIPAPRGEDLVATAKRFLGLPYLWAGVSAFGFDCSGFTYAIHRFHGIDIPRDAKDQAEYGSKVEPDDLRPGDLLFFAYDEGKGTVHHVAIYIGNGQMIHAPKSERAIEIIPASTPDYASQFAGARRYVKVAAS